MGQITYREIARRHVQVFLDGVLIGSIEANPIRGTWRYFPRASSGGGEEFASLAECKASLKA